MFWAAGITENTTTPEIAQTSKPDTYTQAKAWLLAEIDQQIMAIQASGDDGDQLRELTTLYRDIHSLTDGFGAVDAAGTRVFWLAPLAGPMTATSMSRPRWWPGTRTRSRRVSSGEHRAAAAPDDRR
jgi:hypothetical protein